MRYDSGDTSFDKTEEEIQELGPLEEKDSGNGSRELSLVLTKIEEALLWRQQDIQVKQSPVNQKNL
jgi:hypothetical protein